LTSKTSANKLPASTSAASNSSSSSSKTASSKTTAAAVADAKAAQRKASKRAAAQVIGPRTKTHLSLFFGSQTGTAEDFARQVAKEAKTHGFTTAVIDLEDYDHTTELVQEMNCMFFMATYGEGEPTDNAKQFYEYLTKVSRDGNPLKGMNYGVFGLGNKTYEHYNTSKQFFTLRFNCF
jgi:sulfite reductase alpha subunit-like flavoprotein